MDVLKDIILRFLFETGIFYRLGLLGNNLFWQSFHLQKTSRSILQKVFTGSTVTLKPVSNYNLFRKAINEASCLEAEI